MAVIRLAYAMMLLLAGCSSDGSNGDCEINSRTGQCNPSQDPAGCLSKTILCRCASNTDNQTSTYQRLDCVDYCKGKGYTGGTCLLVPDVSLGSDNVCGCSD
jgi:hypothetical protein